MTALFLQGNSRDVLKNLPADYFHCCVSHLTSVAVYEII